jgi:oxygen-independent coproporphyrinogen-3 oxidase
MATGGDALSLYLHFPFCARKCTYCDFNSRTPRAGEPARYLEALRRELTWRLAQAGGARIETVYLGGGTPTLYAGAELGEVLGQVRAQGQLAREAEVTCEANPGTVDAEKLRALYEAGCNRLSLGVQSFCAEELRLLGRIHSAAEAEQAFAAAREVGFANLSLDLIAGLPGQTVDDWRANLHQALDLEPEHLSCYGLSLSAETPLGRAVEAGELALPPEDVQVEIWWITHETLTSAGYEHYEISNFCRPGHASRHNLAYWRNQPYLGVGAGAWSWWAGVRAMNPRTVADYLRAVAEAEAATGKPFALKPEEEDRLSLRGQAGETLMLGMRLAQGVSPAELGERYGEALVAELAPVARQAEAEGLLEREEERWRPTWRGMLLNNRLAGLWLE